MRCSGVGTGDNGSPQEDNLTAETNDEKIGGNIEGGKKCPRYWGE